MRFLLVNPFPFILGARLYPYDWQAVGKAINIYSSKKTSMNIYQLSYFIISLALGFLNSFSGWAQNKNPLDVSLDTSQVDYFTFTDLGNSQAFLKMEYGKSTILNPASIELLKGYAIEKVQLVFTRHPKNTNLTILNQQRLVSLYEIWPEIFESGLIQWKLVEQTDCQSAKEAKELFHGFVINYREPASYSGSLSGAKKMELLADGKIAPKDSTVLKVLDRNKQWEEMLVVADLTGSMSPYVGQLLLWMKLNSNSRPVKFFVFFNDGDGKSDFEKEIGNTGGIYHTEALQIEDILNTAKETMRNGFGGDEPENNVEAILFGIKQYPQFKELIMISDNWATPRDLVLLSEVNIPIRIVLCGTEKGINPRYLDIARRTKGSVHTIEDDLETLMEINEGESISIDGRKYKIERGRFKLVR